MKRERNRAGKWGAALWLVCAAPVVSLAEGGGKAGRSERPAEVQRAEKHEYTPGKRPSPAGDDVWPEVENFMKAHSKRKWAVYQKLDPEKKRVLRGQLINRYVELKRVANKDVYELEVQRVEIEDEMFGALSDLKRARSPREKERIRSEALRPAVAKLIRNRMQVRQVRLTILENQVNRVRTEVQHDEQLKSDAAKFDTLVTNRARQIERAEVSGPVRPAPNRHPPAGPGPATAPAASIPSQPAQPSAAP